MKREKRTRENKQNKIKNRDETEKRNENCVKIRLES